MPFVPETPTFLLSKGRYDGARSALEFLYGHPYVESELHKIRQSIEYSYRKKATALDLLKPVNLKPLLISMLLQCARQLSGVKAIVYYSVTVFEACNTELNSFVENIIVGVVLVVSTVVSALVVDHFGRRCLLITSGSIMAVSISILGAYFLCLRKTIKQKHPLYLFCHFPVSASICLHMH